MLKQQQLRLLHAVSEAVMKAWRAEYEQSLKKKKGKEGLLGNSCLSKQLKR
jgi:hypothetical protein